MPRLSVNTERLRTWGLQLQWEIRRRVSPTSLEREIPPPWINYNQQGSAWLEDYLEKFKGNACLKELPFLMTLGLNKTSVLLDYGCGLGRLGYAASRFLDESGQYIGYEPNQEALRFLRTAYEGKRNFRFYGEELPSEEDYVAVHAGVRGRSGKSSLALDLRDVGRIVDIQFSGSVTTHMWMPAINNLLGNLNAVVKPDGVCVNTWLIIDDFARYALSSGVADRKLPYVVDGAHTYSRENPLVCTAYDLGAVEAAYEAAGHRIQKIYWGSWSGRENGVTYQDIVVSRPRP